MVYNKESDPQMIVKMIVSILKNVAARRSLVNLEIDILFSMLMR